MERTLILVKPDGMQRGLAFEILGRLERRGLKIVGLKLMRVTDALAARALRGACGKAFYQGLIAYITSAPIVAAVFEGTNAVACCAATMGKTNPVEGRYRHDSRRPGARDGPQPRPRLGRAGVGHA